MEISPSTSGSDFILNPVLNPFLADYQNYFFLHLEFMNSVEISANSPFGEKVIHTMLSQRIYSWRNYHSFQ